MWIRTLYTMPWVCDGDNDFQDWIEEPPEQNLAFKHAFGPNFVTSYIIKYLK